MCLRACFFCKLCVLKFRWIGMSFVIVDGVHLMPFLGCGMIEGRGYVVLLVQLSHVRDRL